MLIGGDIVRTSIAQLTGQSAHLPWRGRQGLRIWIAHVAFSFGWVAYSFYNLLTVFGDLRLMPTCNHPCISVNCSTGFAREIRSWVLGRLLRDYKIRHEVDPRPEEEGGRGESIRIDVFTMYPRLQSPRPTRDFVWWMGWAIILTQLVIATLKHDFGRGLSVVFRNSVYES